MADTIIRTSGKLSLSLVLLGAATASAATSFSNSLTGFTGDSTLPDTQAAVLAAGFDFFMPDPAVVFDLSGAHFGTSAPGDDGRNYMRTTQGDFATTNFTAEITFVAPDLTNQDAFFGLGTGDTALFGWPDWSTLASSVLVLPQIKDDNTSQLTTFRTQNDVNEFVDTPAPTLLNGTHRVRLAFNSTAKTATFSVDVNYAGGPFAADATAPPVDVSTLYSELGDGWPDEPSRLYFGGDDAVVFKDFSVTVGNANFNGDSAVDGKDFLIWQAGFGRTSGATLGQGDADNDGDVDAVDFATWKAAFGGAGAVASAGAIPEPTSVLLAALGLTSLTVAARRKT